MPVQLYKDQKKIYTHAPEDIKSKMKKNEKYSIFGKYQGAMNFAYVPISNVERNNKGLYTESYREPSYYNENLHRLNRPSIDVPVWLLPFTDKSKDENQVIEPVSIVQPVTPSHKEDERLITQLSNQAEKTVEQLGIAQNVKPTNTLIEKTVKLIKGVFFFIILHILIYNICYIVHLALWWQSCYIDW